MDTSSEIKEILDRLERIDHKEYQTAFEFVDSATFDEMARCFEERKKMLNYITNLQEQINNYENNKEEILKYIKDKKHKMFKSHNQIALYLLLQLELKIKCL